MTNAFNPHLRFFVDFKSLIAESKAPRSAEVMRERNLRITARIELSARPLARRRALFDWLVEFGFRQLFACLIRPFLV
jgi:hypothetical protein